MRIFNEAHALWAAGQRYFALMEVQDDSERSDTYLRVTRQVDRFAQVELRAAELRKSPGPRDETTASLVASAAPGICQSEDSAT